MYIYVCIYTYIDICVYMCVCVSNAIAPRNFARMAKFVVTVYSS